VKRTIPLLIASASGVVMIVAFFVPRIEWLRETAFGWFNILAAIAFILGGGNLLKLHLKKISDRQLGWGFSAVTVAAFLITLGVGLLKVGVPPSSNSPDVPWSGEFNAPGSAIAWLYAYTMAPITATMFSLLAFFVASAAFRAFRAKNLEATLLLVTAFIVLLGRSYGGHLLTGWFPEAWQPVSLVGLTSIIMDVFNTAGQRAIMIGVALGLIATSLRIILGVDRSFLGTRD
jgi:hypothetical protein